jgi:hypothetical protein
VNGLRGNRDSRARELVNHYCGYCIV